MEGDLLPDIAISPQPGLMMTLARRGDLVDLNEYFPSEYLEGQYEPSWLDMATDGEMLFGIWHHYYVKSLVWYPAEEFEAAGYEVPQTWDELIILSDQIVAAGGTPWCVGIKADISRETGWMATDWLEDVMLRTASPEQYDAWTVTGDLPFSSPEVMNAADKVAEIWFHDDYVLDGRGGILYTNLWYAHMPMFADPPRCWLTKQANFITNHFPENAVQGVDYGVFYLPPIDKTYGKPLLISGDIISAVDDRPEVLAVVEFYTRGEALRPWMEAGGALAPQRDANLDWYSSELDRQMAEMALEATTIRFDGSDLMPAEVGKGTFWSGMATWVSGKSDLEAVMADIDASWPR